jgi:hypothetical protein
MMPEKPIHNFKPQQVFNVTQTLQFLSFSSEGGRCIHPVFGVVNRHYQFFYIS